MRYNGQQNCLQKEYIDNSIPMGLKTDDTSFKNFHSTTLYNTFLEAIMAIIYTMFFNLFWDSICSGGNKKLR